MVYHIILDDGNLSKSALENNPVIFKSVRTIDELREELHKYWFHYEDTLSTDEEMELKRLSRELKRKIPYDINIYAFANLWHKKYKIEQQMIPAKISYINNIIDIVDNDDNKNKLISCDKLSRNYECCFAYIYVNDDVDYVGLSDEDWKIMFPSFQCGKR